MTIKEKAKKYKEEHPATLLGEAFIAEEAEQSYFDGAIAILDEIEQIVDKFDRIVGYKYNELYTRIKDKIKELKGE